MTSTPLGILNSKSLSDRDRFSRRLLKAKVEVPPYDTKGTKGSTKVSSVVTQFNLFFFFLDVIRF